MIVIILFFFNLPSVKNFGEIEFWFALIKIVAIIALIIHTYLKQRQDILIGEMEELGSTYLLALDGDSHAN